MVGRDEPCRRESQSNDKISAQYCGVYLSTSKAVFLPQRHTHATMHPVYQRQRRELGENSTYPKTASIACFIRVEELSDGINHSLLFRVSEL